MCMRKGQFLQSFSIYSFFDSQCFAHVRMEIASFYIFVSFRMAFWPANFPQMARDKLNLQRVEVNSKIGSGLCQKCYLFFFAGNPIRIAQDLQNEVSVKVYP